MWKLFWGKIWIFHICHQTSSCAIIHHQHNVSSYNCIKLTQVIVHMSTTLTRTLATRSIYIHSLHCTANQSSQHNPQTTLSAGVVLRWGRGNNFATTVNAACKNFKHIHVHVLSSVVVNVTRPWNFSISTFCITIRLFSATHVLPDKASHSFTSTVAVSSHSEISLFSHLYPLGPTPCPLFCYRTPKVVLHAESTATRTRSHNVVIGVLSNNCTIFSFSYRFT